MRAINLTKKVSDAVQRSLLADSPDIVIATPARAYANLKSSALSLENLAHFIIDEADLVLSYGYDEDLQHVANMMPRGVQTILMSATLTSEVETLKGLFCRDPVILELDETEEEGEGVSQYIVKYVMAVLLASHADFGLGAAKTRSSFSYTSYSS
jgi:ATP-dependent RNA helicase DDX56/DBP9